MNDTSDAVKGGILLLFILFIAYGVLYWIDTAFTVGHYDLEPHEHVITYQKNYWFKDDINEEVQWREVEPGRYEWCTQNKKGEWVEMFFIEYDGEVDY